jgi:cell division protein FtsA
VLSDEEKEAGVALIDIGGGTTDITIFQEGIIRHTAVVPFGGDVITRDIKEGCTVMHDQAEKLKIRFGSALSEEVIDNRIITIPGLKGRDPKEISEKNLALVIQSRLEEIFDLVHWEIKRSGFEHKLIAGLVLTGGGALLKNIGLLASFQTGLEARIGKPTEHLASGFREEISSPIFATGIGLLIHGIDNLEHQPKKILAEMPEDEEDMETIAEPSVGAGSKWLEKIFNTTKGLFEASPDSELE